MIRAVSILKDYCRILSLQEFIAFLWNALFRNEMILIYCKSLQRSDIVDPSKNNAFPIIKGELADLQSVRSQLERVPWEFKCDLYDGVRDFFLYWDKESGTIGHISWLYYMDNPNRTLRLGHKECEIMFCLTLPEFRGKGLYPTALHAIQRYLKERGYERCFICVKDDNLSSIQGIEKAGFHLAGRTRFRKILGIQVSRRCETWHLMQT